jgi:hypothetical protein
MLTEWTGLIRFLGDSKSSSLESRWGGPVSSVLAVKASSLPAYYDRWERKERICVCVCFRCSAAFFCSESSNWEVILLNI